MLSSTASPLVKNQSVSIPESMQKLIAKLQGPKKTGRKSVYDRPLSLEHRTFKKSKLDSWVNHAANELKKTSNRDANDSSIYKKFPNTDAIQKDDVSTSVNAASCSTKKYENLDSPSDLFLKNDEKTFVYPRVEPPNKTIQKTTHDEFSAAIEREENEPVMERVSDLKSVFKTPKADKDDCRKWVTFSDMLKDSSRGSFVDGLYDEDDEQTTRSHHPLGRAVTDEPSAVNEDTNGRLQLNTKSTTVLDDNINEGIMRAIQRIRKINELMTLMSANENEEIDDQYQN